MGQTRENERNGILTIASVEKHWTLGNAESTTQQTVVWIDLRKRGGVKLPNPHQLDTTTTRALSPKYRSHPRISRTSLTQISTSKVGVWIGSTLCMSFSVSVNGSWGVVVSFTVCLWKDHEIFLPNSWGAPYLWVRVYVGDDGTWTTQTCEPFIVRPSFQRNWTSRPRWPPLKITFVQNFRKFPPTAMQTNQSNISSFS